MSTSMYAVVDPSTGDLVKEYPTATDEQIEQAARGRCEGAPEWSRGSTVAERAALIRRVGELHTERKDELAKIIQREMGKPLDQSEGEVDFSAAIYEYYADNAREVPGRRAHRAGRGRGLRADPPQLGRRAARDHAVELPVLPGGAVRGPEPGAGQHHRAQARTAVPRVGGRACSRSSPTPATRRAPTSTSTPPTSRSRTSSPTRGCKGFR